MKSSNKLIFAGAGALVLLALAAASFDGSPSTANPNARDFSSRFQPTLDVAAGIGSTRDLKPVPLDPPLAAPSFPGSDSSAERGHHGPGRPHR